ncbi:MAG: Wadjet anti-phage system protein JetD domain-containing protein [bacterium]
MIEQVEQSGLQMYYFGDLDPDGLLIFQQAESLLNGQLVSGHMDAETYRRYVRFEYPLSEGRVARLSQLG